MTHDLVSYNEQKREKAKKDRIFELTKWLTTEYLLRLGHIRRCGYFGIPADETEYHLQKTAYLVEQELRKLKGQPPLDSIEMIDILGEK